MHMLNLAVATFFIVQSKGWWWNGFSDKRAVKLCPSGALPLHPAYAIVLGKLKNIATGKTLRAITSFTILTFLAFIMISLDDITR